jgi:hypothetical protein
MKRILIAQLARLDRERRLAANVDRPQLALHAAPYDPPTYGNPGSTALERSALSAVMVGKSYSR